MGMTMTNMKPIHQNMLIGGTAVALLVTVVAFYPISGSLFDGSSPMATASYNGQCYTMTGESADALQKLNQEWELKAMKVALEDIDDPNAKITINFFGSNDQILEFVNRHNVEMVTDINSPNYVTGKIAEGHIAKAELEKIVSERKLPLGSFASSVEDTVLINDPSLDITANERAENVAELETFWANGLKQIIDTKSGVMKGCS